MSRPGRYAIDTMKIWASKWNLKLPVPPYQDVNYWEGVYRTTNIHSDPPFEWGNLSCADLLTHTYEPIAINTMPAFSTISIPHSTSSQQQQQEVKPVQVRRKHHPIKGRGRHTATSTTSTATATTATTTHIHQSHNTTMMDTVNTGPITSHIQQQQQDHRPDVMLSLPRHPNHSSITSTTSPSKSPPPSKSQQSTTTRIITTTLGELLGHVYPNDSTTTTTNNHITTTAENDESILMLGCGTSQWGADMLRHDWKGPILQLDCSSRLMDRITHHPQYQEWISNGRMVAIQDDATVLSALQDNTIHSVFDKGLIDAFFCTDSDKYMTDTLASVHRVLRPKRTFCTLSLSHPKFVLPKLLPSLFMGGPFPNATTGSTSSSSPSSPSSMPNHPSIVAPSRFMIQQRQQQIHQLWSHIEVRLIMDYMYCYRFTKK